MSQAKIRRPAKRQLGQYMTPTPLARAIVESVSVTTATRVLEPSFGDGSFVIALIEKFLPLYDGSIAARLEAILNDNIFGVEVDPILYRRCLEKIADRWGGVPASHNLVCTDFFRYGPTLNPRARSGQIALFAGDPGYDLIIGNPPFGGTIDPSIQDDLDRKYGFRNGEKIKKETYSFFVVKCLDGLQEGGRLLFICSDTFTTIKTMKGLRRLLMEECAVSISRLEGFSEETSYPMVLLDATRSGRSDAISADDRCISRRSMELTGNFSWAITDDLAKYFSGPKLGEFVLCSSGMTIGRNELFLREIRDNEILEPYDFEFFDDPITVAREVERARLGHLSPAALASAVEHERAGLTRRNVRSHKKVQPERILLPHPDYRLYNKAAYGIFYTGPTHAIFWRDEGDAVLTFKKNGSWYLHGVGGRPYFGRSGLTWQLVASRLNPRYLPPGYILDSGAPCAFLRRDEDENELFFILGWASTQLCSILLKKVINHTVNIQGKDFERLPYPFWVGLPEKTRSVQLVRALVDKARKGYRVERHDSEVRALESLYLYGG